MFLGRLVKINVKLISRKNVLKTEIVNFISFCYNKGWNFKSPKHYEFGTKRGASTVACSPSNELTVQINVKPQNFVSLEKFSGEARMKRLSEEVV